VPHRSQLAETRLWKDSKNCASWITTCWNPTTLEGLHELCLIFAEVHLTYKSSRLLCDSYFYHLHSQPLSFTTTSSLNRSHSFLLFAWCSSPLSPYSHTPIHALSLHIRSPGRDFDSICKSFCLKRPLASPHIRQLQAPRSQPSLLCPVSPPLRTQEIKSASDKPR
jgi:hypothetical protein